MLVKFFTILIAIVEVVAIIKNRKKLAIFAVIAGVCLFFYSDYVSDRALGAVRSKLVDDKKAQQEQRRYTEISSSHKVHSVVLRVRFPIADMNIFEKVEYAGRVLVYKNLSTLNMQSLQIDNHLVFRDQNSLIVSVDMASTTAHGLSIQEFLSSIYSPIFVFPLENLKDKGINLKKPNVSIMINSKYLFRFNCLSCELSENYDEYWFSAKDRSLWDTLIIENGIPENYSKEKTFIDSFTKEQAL